jgi:tetratricopeptide (TPR) repeat protein
MRPRIFIGSSSESFHVAQALGTKLADVATPRLWRDVFQLGETSIESLLRELKRADYAVLVATHDDLLESRGEELSAPRDNVVFETGLFIGALGRFRTFLVCDVRSRMKLPSDLAGVAYATFDSSVGGIWDALEPAAQRIRVALSAPPRSEIDFLRAYLAVIRPQIKVSDTYAHILDGHLSELIGEADRLARDEDWARLLELKLRLREYFEFSGRYLEGVTLGRAYVAALRGLGQLEEAVWARVKHLGYMLILAGELQEGRREIHAALGEAAVLPESASISRLRFYAHRYLGISYQRDASRPRVREAREHFERARALVDRVTESGESAVDLRARILRNFANLESQEGNHSLSLSLYQESLRLFEQAADQEHAGVTHLAIAQTLIRAGDTNEDPLGHLSTAEEIFSRIGWLEGLGRVQEQYARHWLTTSTRIGPPAERVRVRELAARHARTARSLYERIRLERMMGRMDALLEQIDDSTSSPIA